MDYFREHEVNIIISLDGPYDIQKIRRPMTREQYDDLISVVRYAASTYNDGLKTYAVVENKKKEYDKTRVFLPHHTEEYRR